MTIEVAIEAATTYVLENGLNMTQLEIKAIKLGIEALKRVKECGCPARCGLLERLPGETKE